MTAIVAGIVAGVFGGSNVQVSGPTGAMTVVLVPIVARYGADAVFVVGIMAGVLIVAPPCFRLGRYLAFIPWPVIEGFTVGIAVIIFLQQVPAALGVPKPEGENTAAIAVRAIADRASHANGAGARARCCSSRRSCWSRRRIHRSLPASLLAVVIASVVAARGRLGRRRRSARSRARCRCRRFPAFSGGQVGDLLGAAFAVARARGDRELAVGEGRRRNGRHRAGTIPIASCSARGLPNIVSPLFGGMPATGAIARTAVNVRAGARTRVSAIVHALVLVLVVLFAGPLVAGSRWRRSPAC